MNIKFIRIKVVLFTILLSLSSLAQNWPKIYGDNISVYGRDLLESYDKGYIICGSIDRNAELFKFGWLIKTDVNGNILWDKKFGNYQVENFFLDFDNTDDNGLILAGATAQEDIERDPLFVKVDACGEIEWCKIFLSEGMNHATGIIHLPNGQFLGMLEYYGGDPQDIRISLVKMDTNGDPIWIKNLAQNDSVANEEGMYLDLTPDSNYLVSGSCFSPGIKPYFIKADTSGKEIWNIKWPVGAGGFAGRSAFAVSGSIYNASHLKFENHPKVPYLLKFDNSGQVINQYSLMGDTIYNGGASTLMIYNDTTIYIGTTWIKYPTSFNGFCDILKIDTLGNQYLSRTLIDEDLAPTSIIKSYDNKILSLGYFFIDGNWDIYMWKMNSDLEDDTLYTQPLIYDSLCPYEIQSDTILLDCGLFVNINEIPSKKEYESTIKISPNPARDWVMLTLPDVVSPGEIELAVYNTFGQQLLNKEMVPQNRILTLNISDFTSGLYIAVGKDQKNRMFTGKFVIVR
jgi:hypothetical protein